MQAAAGLVAVPGQVKRVKLSKVFETFFGSGGAIVLRRMFVFLYVLQSLLLARRVKSGRPALFLTKNMHPGQLN